ncbi:MAG: ATP-binding protein [Cryomorphaceae bacterium]|nr:putative DNA binding domain-containing protein [Flavobacteriales bacterium]
MNKQPLSRINSLITEEYLFQKEENQYFERKGLGEKDIKPTKIADELIGMLNADGGVLVFGVSNDGTAQDVQSLGTKLNDYRTLVIDFIQPSCNIELEEIVLSEKLMFLYHVEQDFERLYSRRDNESVFLRVHDTNRKLDRDGVKKLEYDKAIRKFEEEVIPDFELEDFDYNILEEYRKKVNYDGKQLDLLTKRYLAKKQGEHYLIKNSAVLLFAKDPEKYIPSASVRYVRYEGKEALTGTEHNVVKDQRFESHIPGLIDEVKTFLRASLRDYYFLDMNEGKFRKVPEYPEEAWLEGIVNAMCHRSYNSQGSAIYIRHFDDRLEISNSGPLPAQVTIENIKTERFSRNPRVARVLEDMGYVRQLNEGVSRIYESMEKSMLSIPEYKEVNGNIYLTLRNKISGHSKTIHDSVINKIETRWGEYNATQKKIIHYLLMYQSATKEELSIFCETHINTIRRYLNQFVERKLVERKSEKQRDAGALYAFKKH